MRYKFKKGDKVKVVNRGRTYSSFYDMAKALKLENWENNKSATNEMTGKVVNISSNGFYVGISTKERDFVMGEDGLELVKEYNLKAPTHLVVWEEDTDPCEFFESEQEAKDFVKELSEKDSVKKDSILLVEIKSVRKVTIRKSLTFAQHKI